MMVCVIGLQEYPRDGIFVENEFFSSEKGIPQSPMANFLWHDLIDLATNHGF